jgi:hypothetical protein
VRYTFVLQLRRKFSRLEILGTKEKQLFKPPTQKKRMRMMADLFLDQKENGINSPNQSSLG